MPARQQWILITCLIAALALLAGGFALAARWPAALAVLVLALAGGIAWRFLGRFTRGWLPSALLVVYLACAAGGLLAGITPALLIAGAALALVTWELAGHAAGSASPGPDYRLQAASVGLGLLLAEAGLLVQLPVPFFGVVAAALLVLFSLYRFFRLFRGRLN